METTSVEAVTLAPFFPKTTNDDYEVAAAAATTLEELAQAILLPSVYEGYVTSEARFTPWDIANWAVLRALTDAFPAGGGAEEMFQTAKELAAHIYRIEPLSLVPLHTDEPGFWSSPFDRETRSVDEFAFTMAVFQLNDEEGTFSLPVIDETREAITNFLHFVKPLVHETDLHEFVQNNFVITTQIAYAP